MMASQDLVDESNNNGNQPAPPGSPRSARLARAGVWVLALGLLGSIVWAAFAPLDEGVPTSGLVAIDTKRKAIQHLQGGIVSEVLVREGDAVKEGQVLMRLDDAATRANYESVRQRYLSLRPRPD